MKVLFFSENENIKKSVAKALEGSSHELLSADLSELSGMEDLSDVDAMISDKKSWQRCVVLFKYFGVLNSLNQKPLLVLANDSKAKTLKFRDSKMSTFLHLSCWQCICTHTTHKANGVVCP